MFANNRTQTVNVINFPETKVAALEHKGAANKAAVSRMMGISANKVTHSL